MDDDIDIEEHDVMEDPRLRNIFGDLSQIKIEPPDEYDDQSMEFRSCSEQDEESRQGSGDTEEYARYGNKIILGSKPPSSKPKVSQPAHPSKPAFDTTIEIKQEVEDSINDTHDHHDPSSVIILGSKPCLTGVIEPYAHKDSQIQAHIISNKTVAKQSDAEVTTLGKNLSNSHAVHKPQTIQETENDRAETDSSDEDESEHDVKESVVSLEDWGPKLKSNPCYCKQCEILFATPNTLLAHNTTAHSFLVEATRNKAVKSTTKNGGISKFKANIHHNKAVKSTARSSGVNEVKPNAAKVCNHCSKYFHDDDALIQHLYQHLNHSSFNKPSLKPKPPQNQIILGTVKPPKFKCKLCGMVFEYYKKCQIHREAMHPTYKGESIFTKLNVSSGPSYPVPSKTVKMAPSFSASGKAVCKKAKCSPNLVPIGTIFKCHKCDVHYTTYRSAVQHARTCKGLPGEWTCDICGYQFKLWAKTMHNLQHKYSDKLVVYTANKVSGRVFYECPDCHIKFPGGSINVHVSSGKCDKKSVFCNKCMIDLPRTYMNNHRNFHAKHAFSKNDIIVTKMIRTTNPKGPIGLLRTYPAVLPKKAKLAYDPPKPAPPFVYYCQNCNTFIFNSLNRQFHLDGKCAASKHLSVVCKFCGLTCFSNHVAKRVCKVFPSILSMVFRDVRTDKLIAPAIPEYFKCPTCDVYFCDQKTVQLHDCKDDHKTCGYCKKKYSDLAHKLHVKFHEYQIRYKNMNQPTTSGIRVTKTKTDFIKKPDSPMAEILKKYEELLPKTWNILFKCNDCDIVYNDLDKVIDHCQNHFNNMESYDMFIKKCLLCNLKFDRKCFEKHRALHVQNNNLSQNSFQIINYSYNDLYKDNIAKKFFNTLTEEQINEIRSRSIYKYFSRACVKMRLVQDGIPGAVMYKCGKCENVVHPTCVSNHNRLVSCNKNNRPYQCKICHVPISTLSTKIDHEKMHSIGNNFQIIYFNEEGDEEFNRKLFEASQVHTSHLSGKRGTCIRFFKCQKCGIGCRDTNKHECSDTFFKKKNCSKCKLFFDVRQFARHMKLHDLFPNKPFKILPFNGVKGAETVKQRDVNLYKCECGLHFTTTKAIEKHQDVCNTNEDVAKEKCSKCGLLFNTTQLVTHLCQHHSSEHTAKFKIINYNPKETHKISKTNTARPSKSHCLYKCRRCDLHCISLKSLLKHTANTKSHKIKMKLTPCPYCKLNFLPQSRLRHIEIHHVKLRLKRNDFDIKTVLDNKLVPTSKLVQKIPEKGFELKAEKVLQNRIDKAIYNNVLYKCLQCENHFLTSNSLKSHIKTNVCNDTLSAKCNVCHFKMKPKSLKRHLHVHHKIMKLKKEDLVIRIRSGNMGFISLEKDDSDKKEAPKRAFAKKSTAKSPFAETNISKRVENLDESDATISNNVPPKIRSCARKSTTRNTLSINSAPTENSTTEGYLSTASTISETSSTDIENQKEKTYKFFNVIFKCSICDAHSFNEVHMQTHIQNTHVKNEPQNEQTEYETCFCGLKFSKNLIGRHVTIHHEAQNLKSSDLYAITLNVTNNDVIGHNHLFRCSICQNYYMKLKLIDEHMKEVEHIGTKSRCPQCDLPVIQQSMANHISLHHEILKLSREDYIIMETVGFDKLRAVSLNDTPSCDEITNAFESQGGKRSLINRNSLQGVSKVKTIIYDANDPDAFKKRITELSKSSISAAADEYLTYLTEYENIKINNLKISDFENGKALYKCHHCGIHFMKHMSLLKHFGQCSKTLSESRTKICYICNLPISMLAIGEHVEIHHKKLKLTQNDFVFVVSSNDYDETREQESVSDISIKLYECRKCSINFVNKGSLKRHSPTGVCIKVKKPVSCKLCGKLFSKLSLIKHIKLHHGYVKSNKTDMSQDVTEDLNTISQEDSDENLDERVNETLDQESVSDTCKTNDYTLYECPKCSINFLTKTSLERHVLYGCSIIQSRVRCNLCKKLFSKISLTRHMKLHHGYAFEDGRSAPYDDDTDNVDNNESTNEVDSESDVDNTNDFELFNCKRCSLSFLTKKTLEYHICGEVKHKYKCKYCSNIFSVVSLRKHLVWHHKKRNVKTNDWYIKSDNDNNDKSSDDRKTAITADSNDGTKEQASAVQETTEHVHTLFHCEKCSLNFLSTKAHKDHFCSTDSIKYKCQICEKLFTQISLTKHMKLHHKKEVVTNITNEKSQEEHQLNEDLKDDNINNDNNSDNTKGYVTSKNQPDISLTEEDKLLGKKQHLKRRNTGDDEPHEISEKISTLNSDLYSNKLYKCSVCSLHFVTVENWVWHTEKAKHDTQKAHCTFCGLAFPVQTLPTHVFVHHEKLKLKLEHFLIDAKVMDVVEIDDSDSETKSPKSAKRMRLDEEAITAPKGPNGNATSEVRKVLETSPNSKDSEQDKQQDVEMLDTTVKESTVEKNPILSSLLSSPSSSKIKTYPPSHKIIKLYKCAECNVCFINQVACYKHVTKHTKIDPIDYIECKVCGYQFLVATSLPKHLNIHHQRPFKPENVLIEEYDPNTLCHGSPKIEIYSGIDRVQSKLITTTCEPSNEPEASKENAVDSVQDSEIIDVESDDQVPVDSSEPSGTSKEMVINEWDVNLTNTTVVIDD